jgi:hypothetical protein
MTGAERGSVAARPAPDPLAVRFTSRCTGYRVLTLDHPRGGRIDLRGTTVIAADMVTASGGAPPLPSPRGPLSAWVLRALRDAPGGRGRPPAPDVAPGDDDLLAGDDLHLALYVLGELHYRSFAGVPDVLEWDPDLVRVRLELERGFEAALRRAVPAHVVAPAAVPEAVSEIIAARESWSLSRHLLERGTLAEVREFAVHRSAYQLKEADPHTWVLPRLDGEAKAAAVTIQFDEYGHGDASRMHNTLFATTMRSLGLDPRYGAYLDHLPGTTLATTNLITMLGLHRRLRGALVGHLATFEMTSVVPMRRYSQALRRLGAPVAARRFYDVHVQADAEHQLVARNRMVAGLMRDAPELAGDVLFGVEAVLHVEDAFACHLRDAWAAGASSLLGGSDVAA